MNQSRVGVFVLEPRSWVNAEERETKTDWLWLSHVYKLYLCLWGVFELVSKIQNVILVLYPCLVHIPLC